MWDVRTGTSRFNRNPLKLKKAVIPKIKFKGSYNWIKTKLFHFDLTFTTQNKFEIKFKGSAISQFVISEDERDQSLKVQGIKTPTFFQKKVQGICTM